MRFLQTGTKSLQLALEMLGHKIYDMQAIAGDEHIHFLEDVGLEPGPAPRKPRGWVGTPFAILCPCFHLFLFFLFSPIVICVIVLARLYPASKGDKARDEVFDQWHEARSRVSAEDVCSCCTNRRQQQTSRVVLFYARLFSSTERPPHWMLQCASSLRNCLSAIPRPRSASWLFWPRRQRDDAGTCTFRTSNFYSCRGTSLHSKYSALHFLQRVQVILTTHPSEDSHQWLQSLEETWTAFAPISGGRFVASNWLAVDQRMTTSATDLAQSVLCFPLLCLSVCLCRPFSFLIDMMTWGDGV